MGVSVKQALEPVLGLALGPAHVRALVLLLGPLSARDLASLNSTEAAQVEERVKTALRLYCPDIHRAGLVRQRLAQLLPGGAAAVSAEPHPWPDLSMPVASFDDSVRARVAAKDMALRLGFSETMGVRVATVVSELSRNILFYAGTGTLVLHPCRPPRDPRTGIRVVASDRGPGIDNLEVILAGHYKSARGMGLGLKGVKQLMDTFQVDTAPGKGTVVTTQKWL